MNRQRIRKLLFGELSWKRVGKTLLFVYGFLLLYAMFWSDRIIFQPQPSSYKDTKEIIKLTTSDGVKISAIHVVNTNATYTLLYSHGNAEDLGDLQPALEEVRDMGFSIFAYDYHGYGTSGGKPSEAAVYRDVDAAYDYMTGPLKIPPSRIIAMGRSVGNGAAVDLASRRPVAGLICESPFVTAFRVLTVVPIVPFDKFRNNAKIGRVKCPVLVMHGEADRVIPCWHGKKLFELANEPKRCLWVPKADHDNVMWVAGAEYLKTLKQFVAMVQETQAGKASN